MNLCGLTDSLATLHAASDECPRCHLNSRVAHGLCLGCLLQAGIESKESVNLDEFDAALAAVAVPDTNWRLGNYEILEEIGRGGMGVIYRARQRHSRRIVALKRVLSYHADSRETLVRFRREAEAAASLDHPNILPIYEVGESDDGVPFFSMKYASGGSLQEVGPALRGDPREIVGLMAKVTRAVQHAHRQGILHRDLKPGNILLDGRGEPLVSDFGLAKWLDASSDITRTLTIFGTPGYIAPEQAEGGAADLKSTADVYSLGAILFDLLAGRPPFLGEHALAVIRQASNKPAPRLRSLVHGADKDLETICARCLEREPESRYRSAGDLAEDLERWLEGRPIIARPISPPAKVWRWAKRNPVLAGSLACVLGIGALAVTRQLQARRLSAKVFEAQLASHSILVLPFLDLDSAQADEPLAPLFTALLQDQLSHTGPVKITMPTRSGVWAGSGNAEDMREANQLSRARAILTGSKRAIKDGTRLSLRLINAATGEILLVRSIEVPRKVGADVPLGPVVPEIRSLLDRSDWSSISPAARDAGMRNPAAREFIVSGRQFMFRDSAEDSDRSIACLEKAIEMEPNSALSRAYLSSTLAGRYHLAPDTHWLDRAEREAKEASRLAPDLPEAHRALAGVYFQREDFSAAVEEQFRAVEAGGPEERVAAFLAMTLERLGRPHQALGWLKMARHWASMPGDYDAMIGDCWSKLGDDQLAEQAYRRSIELRPEISEGWVGLCHLRLLQGKFSEARAFYLQNRQRFNNYNRSDTKPDQIAAQVEFFARNYPAAEQFYRELAARDNSNGVGFYESLTYDSVLARLKQIHDDAHGSFSHIPDAPPKEPSSAPNLGTGATVYRLAALKSTLGDADTAFSYLEKVTAIGWVDWRSIQLDPRFDALRTDPRYQIVISRLIERAANLRQQNQSHPERDGF